MRNSRSHACHHVTPTAPTLCPFARTSSASRPHSRFTSSEYSAASAPTASDEDSPLGELSVLLCTALYWSSESDWIPASFRTELASSSASFRDLRSRSFASNFPISSALLFHLSQERTRNPPETGSIRPTSTSDFTRRGTARRPFPTMFVICRSVMKPSDETDARNDRHRTNSSSASGPASRIASSMKYCAASGTYGPFDFGRPISHSPPSMFRRPGPPGQAPTRRHPSTAPDPAPHARPAPPPGPRTR